MERGVVCEVTPIRLLKGGEGLLNIRRTCRGISVITPLSIRRGAGGEASVAVRFCEIGWLNVSVEYRVFCSSVFSVRKNMSFSICHYVILSKKSHLFPFVIMSLCLKKHTYLPPSSCYSVLKTTTSVTPVLLCYPVFHTLSPPVLGYSVFQAEARGEESGKSFPAHGEL